MPNSDDSPPRILQVLEPLVGAAEGVEDLIHIVSVDARVGGELIHLLAVHLKQHGIEGLIKWLNSTGDSI